MKRAGVVVKKTTFRHHLERLEKLGLTSDEHWRLYTGTTRENLSYRHELHMSSAGKIRQVFQDKGYELVDLKPAIQNGTKMDLAIAIGGDGTYLRAAGWMHEPTIPLIGFNSDPESSQGELCTILPHETDEFLSKVEQNQMFKVFRSRVRTRLSGPAPCFKQIRNSVTHDVVTKHDAVVMTKLLPERGLNEVFVGELDSTEPSFLEIEVNQSGRTERIKCSGILISTGTGSTAWSKAVGQITTSEMAELNNALLRLGQNPVYDPDAVLKEVNRLRNFDATDSRLLVSVREPITNRIYSCSSTRFFCDNLKVTSRCYSGMVAIDGKYRYSLPAGAIACFDSDPTSQLCTYPTLEHNEIIAMRSVL